jgi:hypothetical protein
MTATCCSALTGGVVPVRAAAVRPVILLGTLAAAVGVVVRLAAVEAVEAVEAADAGAARCVLEFRTLMKGETPQRPRLPRRPAHAPKDAAQARCCRPGLREPGG